MPTADSATRVIELAVYKFGARPGYPIRRRSMLRELGGEKASTMAVIQAEMRGWIKPLSVNYVELTRRGYIELLKR